MKCTKLCLYICLMSLLFSGCSHQTSAPVESTEEETVPLAEEKRIGICVYQYEDTFMKLYREDLKTFFKEVPDTSVVMADAKGDAARQLLQIKTYIEQGYDGLIINLVRPEDACEITDLCAEADIPVVFINREPPEEEQQRWKKEKLRACYIGADARQAGRFQGEIILDLSDQGDRNGDGVVTYAMIKGDGKTLDSYYRTNDPGKVLQEAGINVSEVFSWPGNWKEEDAYEAAAIALKNYGRRIEVMFCNNDAMALGAARAIREVGLKPGKDVYLVGVDALDEAVSMVKSGEMTGTVLNDHTSQAKKAAEVMMAFVNGNKADISYLVDYLKITGISDYPVTYSKSKVE